MEKNNRLSETYEQIKSILTANNFSVSEYRLIDYGLQFSVSILDWSGLIRVYQNKKGDLKIDYSQLKKGNYAIKIQNLIEGESISSLPNIQKKENIDLGYPIIGTDESGKGDYFGPLVSAGICVDEQTAKKLATIGVKDSKKLTDSKTLELAQKVANICLGRYAIIEISPEKYNELYEQFQRENKNLNTLLAWGHAKAIEEILGKVNCNVAIADQFADERFIQSKLQEKGKRIKLIQMHKAEQHIAVAAASILARARFLEKISKLSNEYKLDLPKGASHKVIENGRKFVDVHGEEALRKVAKLHFKTTDEVIRK
jgi:ribonuclease HIII